LITRKWNCCFLHREKVALIGFWNFSSHDWITLARFHHLDRSGKTLAEISEKETYVYKDQIHPYHPAVGLWKYPFSPNFTFQFSTQADLMLDFSPPPSDLIEVYVGIHIDQSGGMMQEGTRACNLIETEDGFQLVHPR
jgi:hypothetical protein